MSKKIAIVYDWADKNGGVERMLKILFEIFPTATLFTSYYNPQNATWANNLKIKTSFIQKLPDFIKKNRILSVPFYSFAFEAFNFNGYDLVISISSSFAKAVITKPETKHISIILTPTRFLWFKKYKYLNKIKSFFLTPYLEYLRKWDKIIINRPDKLIAISDTVKNRIKNIYKKESKVIYPPFDNLYWEKIKPEQIQTPESFYLVVSRLEPYKNINIVIKSFIKNKKQLIIVGTGSLGIKLKNISKNNKNIIFLDNITDEKLSFLYKKAKALIMIQEEDFGYTSLEAQFFNCPVIAFHKGGASETIIPEKTGLFVKKQSLDELNFEIDFFEKKEKEIKNQITIFAKKNLEKFNKNKFKELIKKEVEN